MSETVDIRLTVNGQKHEDRVPGDLTLMNYLRQRLRLTGTRNGCATGHCGACTVILNGRAVRSCLVKMGSPRVADAQIQTVEGLSTDGKLHPLQAAFIEKGAIQCGYCTAGILMAAKALLDANPNPSDDEITVALTQNRNLCRCTGYVKIIEAIQTAAAQLASGETWIDADLLLAEEQANQPALVRDALAIATGATQFADDIELEGMLHGKILWSAFPHARILSIDTSAAEAMDGVALVVTAKDVPGENIAGIIQLDQPAIAGDKVRYIGDSLAAVFAVTPEIAAAAVELIRVDYQPLPGVFSPQDAAASGAPRVHKAGNLLHHAQILRGDVDSAFDQCAIIVDRGYRTARIEHAFLEPESGIGIPEEDGGITVQMGTQCAFDDRAQLARILALPEEKIRIVQLPMGGAFGGKEDILIYQYLALGALLSQRPVKITLTREESLRAHVKRHPAQMRFKTGADAQGRLLALEAEITLDAGAYASLSVDVLENTVVFAGGPYYIPNVCIDGWAWYTNNVLSGAMRGFGANQVSFALESNLDEIARRLELDPFEIRLRNALDTGLPTVADHVLEEGVAGIKPTLLAARAALNELIIPESTEEKQVGIGIASAVKNIGFGHGLTETAGAVAELDAAGRLVIRSSQHEYGQGSRSGLVRLAADEMGLPARHVSVLWTDTDLTPPTGPTTASRQTFMTGNAVVAACRQLKEELLYRAADELGTDPGNLTLQGNSIVDSAAEHKLPLSELGERFTAEWHYQAPDSAPLLEGQASRYGQPDFKSRPTHWCYTYGTHVAVVEVDRASGRVRVLTVIAAHDVGRVINEGAVAGQIHGGVVQGLGYALSEQFIVEQGINITDSLHKCGVPTADQTPVIVPVVVEVPHPHGPSGLKGFAEAPSLATAPAILNAIFDATGARITQLPATRKRVLEAIQEATP